MDWFIGHLGNRGEEVGKLIISSLNFVGWTIVCTQYEEMCGNTSILYGIQWKNHIEWDIGKENFANSLILYRIWLILVFTSKQR